MECAQVYSALLLILYVRENFSTNNLSLLLNQCFTTLHDMEKKSFPSSDNVEIEKSISLKSIFLLCPLTMFLNCLYVKYWEMHL